MKFPRNDLYYSNSTKVKSDEIPPFVVDYIAKRSIEILNFGPSDANKIKIPNNIKRVRVEGAVSREYFSPSDMTSNTLSLADFDSYDVIKQYISPTSQSGNTIYLSRG